MKPPVKLRNSKCCSVSSSTVIEYSSVKQRLWSDCAYAQADLSICWSHIQHCCKSHVAAHILTQTLNYGHIWRVYTRLFVDALWSPAGKGLTSWLSFSLSHLYPGSGVVLDCIDSWSLPSFLPCRVMRSMRPLSEILQDKICFTWCWFGGGWTFKSILFFFSLSLSRRGGEYRHDWNIVDCDLKP